jgi:WD domain, G-beta repeat
MKFQTPLPCDCVEKAPGLNVLAVGTYLLDKEAAIKRGELLLYCDTGEGSSLHPPLSIASGAIFDAQWLPSPLWKNPRRPLIAAVTSGCGIDIHELGTDAEGPIALHSSLKAILAEDDEEKEASALAMCWLNVAPASKQLDLAISRSDGSISTCTLDLSSADGVASASLRVNNTWKAHSYGGAGGPPAEVWCIATPPPSWSTSGDANNILWSGADDALLKVWDTRALPRAQLTCRGHEAGVCAIAFHPDMDHLVATGSYDQCLRLWDARAMTKEPLASYDTGGGVWKLKWRRRGAQGKMPSSESCDVWQDDLLAACMYEGAQVFRARLATPSAELEGEKLGEAILERRYHYKGHNDGSADLSSTRALGGTNSEPLLYGIEWLNDPSESGTGEDEVASCAFYHRSVHTWKVPAEGSAV